MDHLHNVCSKSTWVSTCTHTLHIFIFSFLFKKSRIMAGMTSLRALLTFSFFLNLFDCCTTLIVHLRDVFFCWLGFFLLLMFFVCLFVFWLVVFLIQEVEEKNWKLLVLFLGFSVLWRYQILLYNTIKVKIKKFGKLMGMYYVYTPMYCCKNFWSGTRGQYLSSAFKQKLVNYLKRTEQVLNWVIKRGKSTWHECWVWHCQIAHAAFIFIHHFFQLLSKTQGKKKKLSE